MMDFHNAELLLNLLPLRNMQCLRFCSDGRGGSAPPQRRVVRL